MNKLVPKCHLALSLKIIKVQIALKFWLTGSDEQARPKMSFRAQFKMIKVQVALDICFHPGNFSFKSWRSAP